MENIAQFFLASDSTSNAVLFGLFGAIGGGLGFLIGSIFPRKIGHYITPVIMVVAIGSSIQSLRSVKIYFSENYSNVAVSSVSDDVVAQLEQQRIFATIFRIYPKERDALKESMQRVINKRDLGSVGVKAAAMEASSALVAKYVQQHMLTAPDAQIHALLQQNYKVLATLNSQPELCVDYFLGKPNLQFSNFSPETLEIEGDLKADIIEQSMQNPSMPEKAQDFDQVVELIVNGYAAKGFSLDGLSKIENLEAFAAQDACKAATEFSAFIASLDAPDGSFVFKNLLLASGQATQ